MGTVSLDEFIANSQAGFGTILRGKPPKEGETIEETPSVVQFCRERSLYLPQPYDKARDAKWLEQLKFGVFGFDAYCPYCKQSTTFRTLGDFATAEVEGLRANNAGQKWAADRAAMLSLAPGQFARHLICQRRGHLLTYMFLQGPWSIAKIGQYPSIEDMAGADLERYRKILDPSLFKELHRAGGLFSHQVGIGSFVYLRRIFERLIAKTRDRVDPEGLQFPDFSTSRMDEKMDLLKADLPAVLVKNKATYGILSKGIHELAEEECLRFFPAVRAAIILMLERDYEAEEKRRAEKEVDDQIAALSGQLAENGEDGQKKK